MSVPVHTLGPTCALHVEPNTRDQKAFLYSSPLPPRVRAQFFYASDLPIDDPLSPIPLPTAAPSSSKPRPFSPWDNAALEETWQRLKPEEALWRSSSGSTELNTVLRPAYRVKSSKANKEKDSRRRSTVSLAAPSRASQLSPRDCGIGENSIVSQERVVDRTPYSVRARASSDAPTTDSNKRRRVSDSDCRVGPVHATEYNNRKEPYSASWGQGLTQVPEHTPAMFRRMELSRSEPPCTPSFEEKTLDSPCEEKPKQVIPKACVPVGASRLHLVEFPNLQMKPIYWSPVHDISSVIRGTWFYRNEMLPVEPALANRLELGYECMKPWTQTWQDELNSCMEIGAEAEEKIVHLLWPKPEPKKTDTRPGTAESMVEQSEEPVEPELPRYENQAAGVLSNEAQVVKQFQHAGVIYADAIHAQILRPSLLPSAYRGRRPLGAIRKGKQVGIPVVRGFDPRINDKAHQSKKSEVDVGAQTGGTAASNDLRKKCFACEKASERPRVTDLVLVIHGIGQKLSERVESFHFTHAINDFRRQVNLELVNPVVAPYRRKGLGGVMVLPVNWRSTLDLGNPSQDVGQGPSEQDPAKNSFSLKDITPESLPAVRNLINDIMLDIPYYLSHHKRKMNEAVIKEANRIYRLWCKNNPGFQETGRVHLLAHSLGSVMALEILSKQPTHLPPNIDLSCGEPSGEIFEFDSKDVFFCGSPIGLFLLLNKATLLPRKGRNKPCFDGEDVGAGVAGEAGTFGCLALDNLYNVIHFNDPIASRINAAVDKDYAALLKQPTIPYSGTTLLSSLTSSFRSWTGSSGYSDVGFASHPLPVQKLPSNIELATHNFTREEIAEKRMYLLNENGQIDYYLSSGGGPLEIQYLNMLGAHSSYWTLRDFIRFLVIEIARAPGKEHTVGVLRAQKKLVVGGRTR